MSEVMTESAPAVVRSCRLEELFEAGFIELLKLVPRNPQVRALILKLTGQLPPAALETFEALRDWMETHCEKRLRPTTHRQSRAQGAGGIAINVEFSETEYGRADYSVPRWGAAEFRVEAEDLLDIAQEVIEAGGSLDEVVDSIAGKIDDDAWTQCEPDMDGYGDYNYSDHESSDSADAETTYSRNDIQAAVRAFLQEHHPGLAAEL